MGSPSPASPVTQTTQVSQMDPRLYQWLYGTANSPGRQQIANAAMLGKTMQGVQNADPTALAAYYNVPQGTDLSQFQSHTGAINPGQADPSLMQFPGRSITPKDYYKEATAGEKKGAKDPTSTANAAKGGELEGYAKGGLTQEEYNFLQNKVQSGKKVSPAYQKQMKAYEKANPAPASNAPTGNTPLSLADAQIGVTPFYDPATMQSTNPYYNQAVDVLKGMGTMPGQYQQASDAYSNLQKMAGYSPQQIEARDISAPMATASTYNAASMAAPENIAARDYTAAQTDAANVERARDIAAPMAQASSYQAARMAAPQEVRAQGYDAATMQAALMGGAGNVSANALQQQQLDRNQIQNLQAQQAQVALMGGPESWAQPGVAQAYMNPYVKTALQAQRDIANRAYAQDLQRTQAEAAGKGAFGGSRTQLALTQQRMNQDLANRATEAQALSQAYTQGMGQFTNEQQMAQAAKGANQSAQNAAYLNYVAQKLAAEQANQGMDYNTALQNMQAKLGVQQAQQQADLQASLANQQYGLGGFQSQTQNLASQNQAAAANMAALNQQRSQYVAQALQAAQANQQAGLTTEQQNMIAQNAASQFNAQNQQQISQANAQMSLAAQQANQQADLSTNQLSAQLRQQSSTANQAAINQQRSQYVAQALQAAQTNYGGQLTTAQQNQVAQNAANQFNAQAQNQVSLANQQAGLQAAQANQQASLAAATQNQQAGLSANQQNISAMGQAGQGLFGVGQGIGAYNQNLMQNWGAAGNTLQNLAQNYYNQRQQSAQNIWGGVNTATQPATGTLLGSPWGTSYQGQYQQRKKGGKLSIKI